MMMIHHLNLNQKKRSQIGQTWYREDGSVGSSKAKEEGMETVKPCNIELFSFCRECIHRVTENRKAIAVRRGNVVPNRQHNIIRDRTEVDRAEINVEAGL